MAWFTYCSSILHAHLWVTMVEANDLNTYCINCGKGLDRAGETCYSSRIYSNGTI